MPGLEQARETLRNVDEVERDLRQAPYGWSYEIELLRAFEQLSRGRQSGAMGPGALQVSEILAYRSATAWRDLEPPEQFLEIMQRFDLVVLRKIAEQQKEQAP